MDHAFRCKRFADFDEYREHLRHWDTEGFQLFPGSLSITQQYFDAGDMILDRTRFVPASMSRSTRRPGWYSLVVDLSPKRWCGIDVSAGSVRLMAPQCETNIVSHQPFDAICIAIQQDELMRWPPPLADFVNRDCPPEHSVLASDGTAVAAFRKWVEALFTVEFGSISGTDPDIWVAAIRDRTAQHVLRMLMYSPTTKPVPSVVRGARYDLALGALHKIHEDAERRWSVIELGQELGVGMRALEYAFQAVFGLSPSQYMLVERLNRARRRLRTSPLTGTSVTSIALDHDFENLSRFALHYRRLFGERPSDTLRSARMAFRRAGNVRRPLTAGMESP
jgi:AraC family ethanolamine operon transcriptional activator